MKPKKRLILALAIIVLLSIPLTILGSSQASSSAPVISAVSSGSTSTSSITLGPPPSPINTTVKIDIRIDNAPSLWGWDLPTINWNASVLQLIKAVKGPFLSDNTGSDTTSMAGLSNILWDNTNGAILGGLAEAISVDDTSTDSSGVLATLTFNITNYGTSQITIAGAYTLPTSADYYIVSNRVSATCNNATVIVSSTSPPPTPTPSPSPSSNSSSQNGTIQVFTDKGGIGASSGGTYGPQDLLRIYGLVTYQNVTVSNQSVLFSLQNSNGTTISVGNGVTNQSGIANVEYRLPAPNPNSTIIAFGTWTITASANVSQNILTNATRFNFNYLSNIENIQMPASVQRLQTIPIELTIDNGLFATPCSELDITIFDQANVPIGSFTYTNTIQMQNFTVIDLSLTIPQSAFTGQATAYICLLTANGTALAPETIANFQILT